MFSQQAMQSCRMSRNSGVDGRPVTETIVIIGSHNASLSIESVKGMKRVEKSIGLEMAIDYAVEIGW
jgi:hypothetical protein